MKDNFQKGVEHGRNAIFCELFDGSDKSEVIKALFGKTSDLADKETDPIEKARLMAYSEGFRHALNILEYRGSALEAYSTVINPDIIVPLTEKDVKLFGS